MNPAVASCMLLVLACSISIAETVEGLVIGIADGDTFTLLTTDQRQVKIRVAEIDAPERGQPYASRSRQQLADLIFQKNLTVRVQGQGLSHRSAATTEAFQCGSKTWCREMVSCEEARFHLESCGLTRLDGDGDGIPCEAMCR